MNRLLLTALLGTVLAAPSFAQSTQFGFLVGGSKRLNDLAGSHGESGINDFKFSNSVREAYYATEVDPDTMFKIKLGQIRVPLIATASDGSTSVVKGSIDHIDAVIDYRFSESYGSTGLFAGVGMYRQTGTGIQEETNFGLNGGVNVDFPLSRRYGVVGEATYHWMHMTERQRFVTLTGGLRISF